MDLLHALTTFLRIVETGSFSAVARESNVSNSAVSRVIGQLEDHFSVRLFHRTTRSLSLTDDGQDLVGHARQLIDAASGLEDSLGRQRTTPTGRVRIGLTAGGARLLTPGLAGLIVRYPGLFVDLVIREHFFDLVEDRLDLAVLNGRPADASLVARQVGGFGHALVAAGAYLEKRGAPAIPKDLETHTCLVHDTGPGSTHWRFGGVGGPHDIVVSSALSASTTEVVRQVALAGHGIALVAEPLVLHDIRAGRLYRLLSDYPTERTDVYLAYPTRRYLAPRTRVVIDFLVEELRAVGERLAQGLVWGENESVWLG